MSADFFATLSPGERIVVRYRLPRSTPDPVHDGGAGADPRGPHLSDAIGNFVSLDDESLTLDTRAGTVTLARADVTHAKRVPAPPPRRGRRRS